jgi:RNA polymerase sigma-70 factor, ECF subfamily
VDADAGLLARAADGDEDAVAQLYDTYARPLYGYGLRRLGDPLLAEELVQAVMTRLWRKAGRFDPTRGSLRTWVFTIARTTAIDLYRRDSRAAPPVPVTDQPEVGDELDRLLRAEAVRAALERLTAEHREALHLAYFRGLTQAEIANRLGLPLGTVKSRTYYALKAFRLACDELGVER